MTGASTLWTLLSSTRISIALRQRAFTSDSFNGSHFFSCSICLSRSDIFLSVYRRIRIPSFQVPTESMNESLCDWLRFVREEIQTLSLTNADHNWIQYLPTVHIIFHCHCLCSTSILSSSLSSFCKSATLFSYISKLLSPFHCFSSYFLYNK